jgi:hypothetical protein
LDRPLPGAFAVGRGNNLILEGWCYHPAGPITQLRVLRDGRPLEATIFRRVRPEVHVRHYPVFDPDGQSLLGGFEAAVDLPPCDRPTPTSFAMEARLADGSMHTADLGRVLLRPTVDAGAAPPALPPVIDRRRNSNSPLVAVCMATCDPPLHLFNRQVESIIAQTHTNWVCIVTDDSLHAAAIAHIAGLAERDSRFRVYRNPSRLGFYHNFERCLALVPPEAGFVALSDHDDDWRPEKLATLLAGFDDDTSLVYSDMRIVTGEGECLSPTYWTTRRNNFTDLASLLVANTITGAAAVFRRELLDYILPLPDRHGLAFHDHWIAAVAMALGKIGYVKRPLYDYVQHGRNVIGHAAPEPLPHGERLRRAWAAVWPPNPRLWLRRLLEYGQVHDVRYGPARQFARLLLTRCGPTVLPTHKKPLRRLAALDRSWRARLWLAARGLWTRPVTLGGEYEMIASLFWRAGAEAQVRLRVRRASRQRSAVSDQPSRIAG